MIAMKVRTQIITYLVTMNKRGPVEEPCATPSTAISDC